MSIPLGVALLSLLTLATGYFVAREFAYIAAHRGTSQQALITDGHTVVGLVAMEDLLESLIGIFDDETDTPPPGAPPRGPTRERQGEPWFSTS